MAEDRRQKSVEALKKNIKVLLDSLTDDERLSVFLLYCRWCGSKEPKCHCMRDE